MSIILDLIGSVVLAGFVILLGLRLNQAIVGTTDTTTANLNVQESLVDLVKTIEYDFRKIGYKVADPKTSILFADSTTLRFNSDIDNNGTMDVIAWSVGPPLTHLPNPNVRGLYRAVNGAPAVAAPGLGVTEFKLKYLDQDGVPVATTYPIPASELSRIWIIETTLRVESPYRVADPLLGSDQTYEEMGFAAAFWRQTRLASRNISRHG